jgi:hypothetical protein
MTATSSSLLAALGGRTFHTILADPPWQFANRTGKVAPEHRRLSGCVVGQAISVRHGVLFRMMALRTVRSFRMTATMASFFGEPLPVRRS